jgi:hypothetical protein
MSKSVEYPYSWIMDPWESIHIRGFTSTDFFEYKYGYAQKYPWITCADPYGRGITCGQRFRPPNASRSIGRLVNSTGNPGVFFSVPIPLPVKTRTPGQGYRFFHGYRILRPLPDPYPYPWQVTCGFLLYFNNNIDIVMSNVC